MASHSFAIAPQDRATRALAGHGAPLHELTDAHDGEALYLTVPARGQHLGSIRRLAREFAEHHGVTRPEDVELAIGEACANVLLHAYVDQPPGPVHLHGVVDATLVYLTIADEGLGMAPHVDGPGLGAGLPIIAAVTERLQVTDRHPSGVQLTMGFAADPSRRRSRSRAARRCP